MSKKVMVILAVLALLLVGGFFAVKAYLDNQAHQAYLSSADKVADDLVAKLISQDVNGAYSLFSTDLKNNYSKNYWKDVFFPKFKDYNGATPKQTSKGAVQPPSSSEPNPYDPHNNQDAQQYQYDFQFGKTTYRVTMVVFRQNNEWKVNELSGAYLP